MLSGITSGTHRVSTFQRRLKDCWMDARRRTACANLRVLFHSVEDGEVFSCVGHLNRGLSSKIVSSFTASVPALGSPYGGGVPVRGDVSNGCRGSNVATPFTENDGSKVLLWNY